MQKNDGDLPSSSALLLNSPAVSRIPVRYVRHIIPWTACSSLAVALLGKASTTTKFKHIRRRSLPFGPWAKAVKGANRHVIMTAFTMIDFTRFSQHWRDREFIRIAKTRLQHFCCVEVWWTPLEKLGTYAGQCGHTLRPTFASHFMMNCGEILTLHRILGH